MEEDLIVNITRASNQQCQCSPLWTKIGRKKLCESMLQLLYQTEWSPLRYEVVQQIRYLNRILPVPAHILNDNTIALIPLKKDIMAFLEKKKSEQEIGEFIISESRYTFIMDLPIKQFQDIKTHLQRKKNLNIQEALVLKCLGIDVLHEHFVEKYFFDARSYLDKIFSLKFQDLLDFIVVLFPSDFNDTSFIILFTPHDFGFVKNEAYTGNDILFTWFSVFKSFDLDLASNCVSNLYIKARYWSAVDQFFS